MEGQGRVREMSEPCELVRARVRQLRHVGPCNNNNNNSTGRGSQGGFAGFIGRKGGSSAA